jgi:hypothetical protein
MKNLLPLIILASLLTMSSRVQAIIITVEIAGTIKSITDKEFNYGLSSFGDIDVGETFSYRFSYDTGATPLSSYSNQTRYTSSAIISSQISVGSDYASGISLSSMILQDNIVGYDRFYLHGQLQNSHNGVNTSPGTNFGLILNGPNTSAWGTYPTLPSSFPELSAWSTTKSMHFEFGEYTYYDYDGFDDVAAKYRIDTTITSVGIPTAVPEPSTFGIGALILLGMTAMRRFRK